MIRKYDDMHVEKKIEMRGGTGEVQLRALLNGEDEMLGKGRLFSQITLPPGASIGEHQHTGEQETFYILSGTGEYFDHDHWVPFSPGDLLQTPENGYHSIKNTGNDAVQMIALILFS